MDTAAQWPPQDIVMKPMEEIVTCPKPSSSLERKARPQKEQALNCPRCHSTNTKFCYYNNYSLSQPRYFCKTCRRYWTEGGSLRNIPVGGGSRKNKRSSSSSSNSSISSNNNNISTPSSIISNNSSIKKLPDLVPQQNPNKNILEITQDLNLGFSIHHHHNHHHHHDFKVINEMIQVPNFDHTKLELQNNPHSSSSSAASAHHHLSSLELLNGLTTTTTTTSSRGLMNSFMQLPVVTSNTNTDPTTVYSSSSGFPSLPEFIKPSLNFSLDGLGSNYGGFQGVQEANNGKQILFPFEDLKQDSGNTNDAAEQTRDHQHGADSTGYWNGVIGGGSW